MRESRKRSGAKQVWRLWLVQLSHTAKYLLKCVKLYNNQHHFPVNECNISWHILCILFSSAEGVNNMAHKIADEDFIGPIKPQMSMTYRDFLMMINTGLGLPRYPTTGVPVVKKQDDPICPPASYRMH